MRVIRSNLNDIISPLGLRLSSNHFKLTPKEIAPLIEHGSTTKEICELLNVSKRTIDAHRSHIREKLSIKGKGLTLKAVLRSLK